MKTITLTNVRIGRWVVDSQARSIQVDFSLCTDDGRAYEQGQAIYWTDLAQAKADYEATYPGQVAPDNWYQLPQKYVALFVDLTVDAQNMLTAKLLG